MSTPDESLGPYSKVYRRIWSSRSFRNLSPIPASGQSLFLYLLTGPCGSRVPGFIRATEQGLAAELKWDLKAFREAFREAFHEGMAKADWDAPLVWLPHAIRFNFPASPNVVTSWKNPVAELPDCDLKDEGLQQLRAFVNGMGKGFQEAFAKAFGDAMPKSVAVAIAVTGARRENPPSPLFPGAPVQVREPKRKASRPKRSDLPAYTPGFERAWSAYPHHEDRSSKPETFAVWLQRDLEAQVDRVCEWIEACKRSRDWTKNGGEFVKGMQAWLRKHDFRADPPTPTVTGRAGTPAPDTSRQKAIAAIERSAGGAGH